MNNRTTKFIPPIKSMADVPTLRTMRDAVNSLLNAKIAGAAGGDVVYSDSNVIYRLNSPPNATELIYPFQIYNVKNTAGGKDALTFQMRDGLISARSKYWLAGQQKHGGTYNPAYDNLIAPLPCNSDNGRYQGNFETILPIYQDGQGQYGDPIPERKDPVLQPKANTGTNLTMVLGEDSKVWGLDVDYTPTGYAQIEAADIIGNYPLGAVGNYGISFWVEIIDDPDNGFYAELWARLFCVGFVIGDGPSELNTDVYPTIENPNTVTGKYGAMIIPVGCVMIGLDTDGFNITGYNGQYTYFNLLTSTQTNRFASVYPITYSIYGPDGTFGAAVGQPMTLRGAWSGTGLVNQVFYPGDVVYDDSGSEYMGTAIGPYTLFFQGVYIWRSDPNFGTSAPNGDGANWQYLATHI